MWKQWVNWMKETEKAEITPKIVGALMESPYYFQLPLPERSKLLNQLTPYFDGGFSCAPNR